jgi:protein involved in polysaccharide export with SLBB domain
MIKRAFILSALLAVALLVSGCSSGTLSESEKQSLALAATEPATLQPGDKIRVVVFGEQGLSGEYELDQAGQISVPLAGTLKVQGMTQAGLEQALAKKFRSQYLRNPKVTVTIASLAPYYIIGEVKNPGQKTYRSGLNVLTAIAIAGGPTYRASRDTVQIQRRGEAKMQQYPISAAVPVLPGDVIKVPERYF